MLESLLIAGYSGGGGWQSEKIKVTPPSFKGTESGRGDRQGRREGFDCKSQHESFHPLVPGRSSNGMVDTSSSPTHVV